MLNRFRSAPARKMLGLLNEVTRDINNLEPRFADLTTADLSAQRAALAARHQDGESLDDLLAESFALTRRAAELVLGQRMYDVQLMGGVALHAGWVTEMRTGEGKTLTAAAPCALAALAGRGVHVVTVNDYLARRDAESIGRVHHALGLDVGFVAADSSTADRKAAYAADVTYATASQFGFDFMRDNLVGTLDAQVQRPRPFFALIDEVDSILIDEARTPMIIAGPASVPPGRFELFAKLVSQLRPGVDFEVDVKEDTVTLTNDGFAAAERLLGVDDLATGHILDLWMLNNALSAAATFERDVDYVVLDGRVVLVDPSTGRLLDTHSYQDGIHQAIEAKEGVPVTRMNQAWARITYPAYFRRYEHLAGMSGTAASASDTFEAVYDLQVVEIPTHRPVIRADEPDVMFATAAERDRSLVAEIVAQHSTGRPILVGTTSVEAARKVSDALTEAAVPHNVLSAVAHGSEAEIVAQAGRLGAVTVATNMAGRGTDILLGGDPDKLAAAEAAASGVDVGELLDHYHSVCAAEREQVLAAGGLLVLGFERNDSRRIDDQLRGRSGRQGDPGASRFFLSLEDKLVRIYGDGLLSGVLRTATGTGPLDANVVSRLVRRSQEGLEHLHDEQRAHTMKFDRVFDAQRGDLYSRRQAILEAGIADDLLYAAIDEFIDAEVAAHTSESWDAELFAEHVNGRVPGAIDPADVVGMPHDPDLLAQFGRECVSEAFERIIAQAPDAFWQMSMKVALTVIDMGWKAHLLELDALEDGIGWRALAQKDPLIAFIAEGDELYEQTWRWIRRHTLFTLATFRRNDTADSGETSADGPDHGALPAGEKPEPVAQENASASVALDEGVDDTDLHSA